MERKIKSLTITLLILGIVSIVMGVSIAFFNYTRTGSANTLAVGRIYFTSSQGNAINLTNVKPVKSTEIENNANVGSVTINVQGDTTYANGIEYLISAKDVVNTINNKKIPISVSITVNNIGTSDDDYFTNRGGNTSIYKNVSDNKLKEEKQLIVGYIKSGAAGINGSVTIKAYIDADKIAISDTYDGTESDNMNTKEEWVNGRTVLTTTEWNSLITGGISFKVKVEANEGVWIEEEGVYNLLKKNADTETLINFANVSSSTNGQGIYRLPGTESDTYPIYYYRGDINNNNVIFGDFCWKMVRTTDTGGVKMIYNGEPDISLSGDDILYDCSDSRTIAKMGEVTTTTNISNDPGHYYADDFEIVRVDGSQVVYRLKSKNKPITQVMVIPSNASTTIPTIIANYPYTCKKDTVDGTCITLYKVDSQINSVFVNVFLATPRTNIGSGAFNIGNTSLAYTGYMYNKTYERQGDEATTGAYYGTNIEYGDFDSNGTSEYRLYNDGNNSISLTKDNNHHYSCNATTTTGTCTKVRYYYFNNYFIELENGEDIDDALYKMTGTGTLEIKNRTINQGYKLNTTDSKIKTEIEEWFRYYLTNEVNNSNINYQKYLEDTIFCNDRSFKTSGSNSFNDSGWKKSGGDLSTYVSFGIYNRLINNWYSTTNVPNMSCPNETDRFSVSNNQAKLNYPVGLLTVDEIILAGASGNSDNTNFMYYLNTGFYYWLLSPRDDNNYYVNEMAVYYLGSLAGAEVGNKLGVRPVVSLKHDTEFENGGDGTPTNPYVVKYD